VPADATADQQTARAKFTHPALEIQNVLIKNLNRPPPPKLWRGPPLSRSAPPGNGIV
jgi:hypothetical protein